MHNDYYCESHLGILITALSTLLSSMSLQGLLPQRQGGRVPVRDHTQRDAQDQARRTDFVHAQVRREGQTRSEESCGAKNASQVSSITRIWCRFCFTCKSVRTEKWCSDFHPCTYRVSLPAPSRPAGCCHQSTGGSSYPTGQQGSYRSSPSRPPEDYFTCVSRKESAQGGCRDTLQSREWSMVPSQSSSKRILFGHCGASRQFRLEATEGGREGGREAGKITFTALGSPGAGGLSCCSQRGRKWTFSK